MEFDAFVWTDVVASVENSIRTTSKYRRKAQNTGCGAYFVFSASRPRYYSMNRFVLGHNRSYLVIGGGLCGGSTGSEMSWGAFGASCGGDFGQVGLETRMQRSGLLDIEVDIEAVIFG